MSRSPGDQSPTGSAPPTASPTPTGVPSAGPSSTPGALDLSIIEPGRLGPLHVGMRISEARSLGLVRRGSPDSCGGPWEGGVAVQRRLIHLTFNAYQSRADDLDQIDVADWEGGQRIPAVRTREGIKVGSRISSVRAAYGDRLHRAVLPGEGGQYTAYVLFGPEGALLFIQGWDPGPARVRELRAARGSSIATLKLTEGC